MHKKIKILLVDDHQMMREALRSLINSQEDLQVVAEAGNGLEAVELAESNEPDIVIMDINMPEMNGVEATRIITQGGRKLRVIGLSLNDKRWSEETVLRAGASVYLSKDDAANTLCNAIRNEYSNLDMG